MGSNHYRKSHSSLVAAPSLALREASSNAGFWATATYTATSVIQVWMQCLAGVMFLGTSRLKL